MPNPPSHPRRWAILAVVLAAEAMDLLDGTIVNVAAPSIREGLHAGASGLQWIIGDYSLAFAVGLLAGARLGDIYGRRRLFVIGALGFAAASAACGVAVDPAMLIACRLAQGTAAALLIPQGLGIIRSVFSPEEQGGAFAPFGPVIGLAATLGPIVGGALIDADAFGTGWRLVFFVNLPLGLAAALGAARMMPESVSPRRSRLDPVGTVLAAAAMGLLVYPLVEGRSLGWPWWSFAMIAVSAVMGGLLVAWSRRGQRLGRDPLVEGSIFGHRAYVAGLASLVVLFAGMGGTLLALTLFLQFGERFSAVHAGLTIAPFAVGSAAGAVLAAKVLAPRFGRPVLQLGALVVAGGVWWFRQVIVLHGLATTTLAVVGPEVLLGAGIGMIVSPLFDFVLASVTDDEAGSASGVLNASQQLAGAIGVAVIGTVFFATLSRLGYVAAIDRCLLVELGAMPVLAALTRLLPKWARQPEEAAVAGTASAADAGKSAGRGAAAGGGVPALAGPAG